jgi:hypothetical protein
MIIRGYTEDGRQIQDNFGTRIETSAERDKRLADERQLKIERAAPDLLAFAEAFMARWNLEPDSKPVSELRIMCQAAISKATSK